MAISSGVNTREGCRRIAQFAFDYAVRNKRRKVTIVHKANVLKALTGVFLETAREVGRKYEKKLQIDDRIVDACAMQLVLDPSQFDVIVTTNLFGDILSDEIAGLVGGLGMAPGANIGAEGGDLRGGARLGAGHRGQGRGQSARAAARVLPDARPRRRTGHRGKDPQGGRRRPRGRRPRTRDLGGSATTRGFAKAVIGRLGTA